MSLTAVCIWSLVRGAVVAGLAAFLAKHLAGDFLRNEAAEGFRVRLAVRWSLLLTPFLAPPLLVGYLYRRPAVWLVNYPAWNEAIYWLLLFMKFVPAAVVVYVFAPPAPLSAEAMHVQKLLRNSNESWQARRNEVLANFVWGRGRISLAAFVVVFLLAFQEFEIASLMGITAGTTHSPVSWTVWLFDAHAGGVPLSDSLKLAITPLVCELVVILPVAAMVPVWLASSWQIRSEESGHPHVGLLNAAFLAMSAVALGGAPFALVCVGAMQALPNLNTSLPLFREIVIGGAIALTVTVLVYATARLMTNPNARRSGQSLITALACLPGLPGSLVLGLLVLGLFQLPGFRAVGESLVPLILALGLFVLPRALVLFAVTGIGRQSQSAKSAWMLAQSALPTQRQAAAGLVDDLEIKAVFWSAVLVFYWTYWEMTPAALLSPPSVIPFSVLLYNFVHYGQNAVLSTMLFCAVSLPIVLIVLLAFLRRGIVRLVMR